MTESLKDKKCVPCEGGVDPMTPDEIKKNLELVDGWETTEEDSGLKLAKQFKLKNFRKAMSFLREVEELAESEGHHPDFCVHYNKVDFRIWTHAIGGLHLNDFIIASGIDSIYKNLDE